jgi:hypothetical protein
MLFLPFLDFVLIATMYHFQIMNFSILHRLPFTGDEYATINREEHRKLGRKKLKHTESRPKETRVKLESVMERIMACLIQKRL